MREMKSEEELSTIGNPIYTESKGERSGKWSRLLFDIVTEKRTSLFPITNRATGGIIDEGLVQAVGV